MNPARRYAQALHALLIANPDRAATYAKELMASLEHRRWGRLVPRIVAELERLSRHDEQTALRLSREPERERTRALFALYQQLIRS